MRPRSGRAILGFCFSGVLLAAPSTGGAQPKSEAELLPLMVYMADGTSLPLRDWSLSYEYVTWPQGTDPALGTAHRRDARELWVGRKKVPTGGLTLEIRRESGARNRMGLVFAEGRKEEVKVEPPSRDLLSPDGQKGFVVLARSLDLRGETLTATKRELCLVAYTMLVECGQEPGQRVVKIEFPR